MSRSELEKPNTTNEQKTAQRILWGPLRSSERQAQDKDRLKFLKKIPFFEKLKKNQLEEVDRLIYEREYNENEFLFEAGHPGAALFIIQQGEVSVEIPQESDQPTQLAVLGKQSFIGELALLDETPRSASARAIVPTRVFALFRKDLDQLAETNPDITSEIYRALAVIIGHRLKATNDLFEKRLKKVA